MATFYNQAFLTYNGTTVNSNTVSGEILDVLSINKTAVEDEYSIGDTITYVVNINNAGMAPVADLTVTDDLGSYPTSGGFNVTPLTYVPGSLTYILGGQLQPEPDIDSTEPLSFDGIAVPPRGTTTLIYKATVNEYARLYSGAVTTNTVTVTGAAAASPLTDSHDIPATVGPNLSITKNLSPTIVPDNGRITYTFTITNTGNAPASGDADVIISDTFRPTLTGVVVTYNNNLWPQPGNYNYVPETGVFSTNRGRVTVPAASYTRNEDTGEVIITPGVTTITVSGTV